MLAAWLLGQGWWSRLSSWVRGTQLWGPALTQPGLASPPPSPYLGHQPCRPGKLSRAFCPATQLRFRDTQKWWNIKEAHSNPFGLKLKPISLLGLPKMLQECLLSRYRPGFLCPALVTLQVGQGRRYANKYATFMWKICNLGCQYPQIFPKTFNATKHKATFIFITHFWSSEQESLMLL